MLGDLWKNNRATKGVPNFFLEFSDTVIIGMVTGSGRRAVKFSSRSQDFYLY